MVASHDPEVRARMKEWLKDAPAVVLARDGDEAFSLVTTVRPAIAILDDNLPGMPGSLVAWAIKNDRRNRDCAVVLVGSPRAAASLSVDAFVAAPATRESLLDAVARVLADEPDRAPALERRAAPRKAVAIGARLTAAAGQATAEIVTMGPAGAFARSSLDVGVGESVAMAFDVGDGRDEIAAEVVRIEGDGAARGLGLRFVAPTPAAARTILLALETRGPAVTPDPPMRRELDLLVGRLRRQQAAMVGLAGSPPSRHPEADAALREVAEVAASIIGVARASIWLLEDDGHELRCRELFEAPARHHSSGAVLHASEYPRYFAALAEGRAIDANEARTDERTSEFRDGYLVPLGITSMMDAAIHLDGKIVGVVCHEHVGTPRRWYPDEVGFAGALADQVALILETERRRRTERALAEAEERTRLILAHAPDAVVTIDGKGAVTSWNPMAERLFDVPARDAVGRLLSELVVPERLRDAHEEEVRRSLHSTSDASAGRRVETIARRRDGTELPIELSLTPVRSTDGSVLAAFVRDLSVEHRMRRELTEASAPLEAIFRSFPDLYFWVRRDGVILRHQAGKKSDLFMDPERFLGRPVSEVLPRDAADAITTGLRKALAERALASVEYSLPLPEGERFYEARLLPLDAERVFAMVRDITSRVELLRRERQARETAEQALTVREEFLSVASHELRTPLTSLQLAVQQTLVLPAITPDAQRFLQMAERQAKRLAVLVDRLLDVSRIQTGQMDLELADTDLAVVVRRVLEAFREEIAATGDPAPLRGEPTLIGRWDASRLEQVVTNLVANAIKYGDRKPIAVALEVDGDHAVLRVEDLGIGIAPEDQERIFHPFARAAPVRSYGGLGLGLFIVAEIVRAHGGSVSVQSSPGNGSTFTVRLPRRPRQPNSYWP